jgi:hypothetical protein
VATQQIMALDAEMTARLDQQREWVWGSVSAAYPLDRNDPHVALSVIHALLDDGIRPDETGKLQALGVVFGDVLSSQLQVPWVVVDDVDGRDPALHLGGSDLAFPLTMISKRVEAGELVDVEKLFGTVADGILFGH